MALLILSLTAAVARAQPTVPVISAWPNFYANSQAEQLLDRGRDALREADHETAVRHVADALQIIRVNHGLRSGRQVEPLQLLIAGHLQARDWEAADNQIDYFQWLNTRNYRLDFPAYLRGSEALSDLLLTASADPQNPTAARYLVAAKNLNWRTISAIEAREGRDSPALIPWLYRVVQNHYHQSALIRRRGLTSYNFHSDADDLVSGFRLRKNESLKMSYNIGRELLQRIAALTPAAAEPQALVAVHQADWELVYGQSRAALEYYRIGRQRMQEAGRTAQDIATFFNRAVIIPQRQLQLSWPEHSINEAISVLAWSPLYPGVPAPLTAPAITATDGQLSAQLSLTPPEPWLEADSSEVLQQPWRLDVESARPDQAAFRELIQRQARLLQFRPMLEITDQSYNLNMQLSAHFLADESLAETLGFASSDAALLAPASP